MRINRVKSARKAQGKCGKCGKELGVGAAYIWVKARFGPKRRRCTEFDCRFRPSEMTGSEIKGNLYAHQESWEDGDQTTDDAQAVVDGCREVVDLIQEKMDNIESGMGHAEAPVYQELEERLYELESWVDEGEDFALEYQDKQNVYDDLTEDELADDDFLGQCQADLDEAKDEFDGWVGNCPE